MNKQPLVSIIVPVYNGEKTIDACIESLLMQDYSRENYDVIVVDNCSDDRTAEIIKKYPVQYLCERRQKGSYAARNTGIRHARGEFLAFTDADCIADKNWLKNGLAGFTGSEIGCVAGGIRSCEPNNYIEEYIGARGILAQRDKTGEMPLPYAKTANAFYRKTVFDAVGLFEEKWVSGGDADLSWRMQCNGAFKLRLMPDAVVLHKHRSTLRLFFIQCMTWGIGSTVLYKKYPTLMPTRTWRQIAWLLWRIIYLGIALVPFYVCNKESMDPSKRSQCLGYFSFLGWECGKIIGSVRHGVFYI